MLVLCIVIGVMADGFFNAFQASLFLGIKFAGMINYLKFWR